jgi:hypothetical protein
LIASVPESASNILLDIGGPDEKDVTLPNALVGVVLAVDRIRKRNGGAAIGILLPFALSEGDLVLPSLERLVEDPLVRLVTGDGTATGSHFAGGEQDARAIARWSAEARVDPIEALEKRLIRRVGQYKLQGSEEIIRRLYDGSRAFSEIYELTLNRLSDLPEDSSGRIGYDVRQSNWFRGPVEAALRDAGLADRSWYLGEELDLRLLGETDLLLLPIVRTGASLRKLVGAAASNDRAPPRVWSLLSTQGTQPKQGTRRIAVASQDGRQRFTQVQYALRVDPGDEAVDVSFWQGAPIEPLDPNREPSGEILTADAMWGMIFEAGLMPESPVPKHREPIGFIPNFGAIARLNGPFLATKVEGLLANAFASSLPPSVGFLCPEEPNASELAESLRELVGQDTIYVGRDLITSRVDRSAPLPARTRQRAERNLNKVRSKLEAWQNLVSRLPEGERPHIVLLDEFNVSGSTFRGLFNLACEFELPVLCTMSLVSYSEEPLGVDVPHLALYRMGHVH